MDGRTREQIYRDLLELRRVIAVQLTDASAENTLQLINLLKHTDEAIAALETTTQTER